MRRSAWRSCGGKDRWAWAEAWRGGRLGQGACQGGPRTYVLRGLKVDNDQSASSALSGEWQVPAGPDLQGGAQRDGQVCVPGTGRQSQIEPLRPRAWVWCPLPPHPTPCSCNTPSPGRPALSTPTSAPRGRPQPVPAFRLPWVLLRPLPFCPSHLPTLLAEAGLLMGAGPSTLGAQVLT